MLEAKPQAAEAQPRDYQSTVAGKPKAYRTVLRPSRNSLHRLIRFAPFCKTGEETRTMLECPRPHGSL